VLCKKKKKEEEEEEEEEEEKKTPKLARARPARTTSNKLSIPPLLLQIEFCDL
jgi:hypothetical protein